MTLAYNDPLLERYFDEIGESVGLSAEAESEIFGRIRKGDEKALGELVGSNLRFVVRIANQYKGLGVPFSDLINEGNVGLITAARRFDASRGFKFITYAVWWIRHAILKALADHSRVVRLPNNQVVNLTRMTKTWGRLEQELGRLPQSCEVAEELQVTPEDVEVLIGMNQTAASLDVPADGDKSDRPLAEFIRDADQPDSDAALYREELRQETKKALAILSDIEAQVLSMYFGLDDNKPLTLEEIGRHFDRTRERMRQVKVRALNKLRRSQHCRRLHDYCFAD